MSLERPSHLVRRQVAGRAFSEDLTIRRTTGARTRGRWVETGRAEDTKCATAPASGQESRVRQLMEGGVQLDAMRLFWTTEDLSPATEPASGNVGGSGGDVVVYAGERYRVRATRRWGGFSESVGVREEGQGS